jgi:hypothetical protein
MFCPRTQQSIMNRKGRGLLAGQMAAGQGQDNCGPNAAINDECNINCTAEPLYNWKTNNYRVKCIDVDALRVPEGDEDDNVANHVPEWVPFQNKACLIKCNTFTGNDKYVATCDESFLDEYRSHLGATSGRPYITPIRQCRREPRCNISRGWIRDGADPPDIGKCKYNNTNTGKWIKPNCIQKYKRPHLPPTPFPPQSGATVVQVGSCGDPTG